MKKTKLNVIISLSVVLVMAFSVFVAIGMLKPTYVKAEEIVISTPKYDNSYRLGDVITIDDTLLVDSQNNIVAKDGDVVFPDGYIYTAGKAFTLNQIGMYSIRYYIIEDGVKTTYTVKFTVSKPSYELSSENGSTITYADNANGIKTHTGADGLIVNLKEGCEFVYNKPIDLSQGSKSQILQDPNKVGAFANLSNIITIDPRIGYFADSMGNVLNPADYDTTNTADATPPAGSYYTPLAKYCVIKLTDAYDPNTHVEITFRRAEGQNSWQKGKALVYVGSSHQEAWGIKYNDYYKPTQYLHLTIDDAVSNAHKLVGDPAYGAMPRIGKTNSGSPIITNNAWDGYNVQDAITFQYDYERNRIYQTTNGLDYSYIVNDLDNEVLYGDNKFKGFTTGEVYVSVKISDYYAESADVEIYAVGNDTKDVLFAKEELKDTKAPEIKVNAKLTEQPTEFDDGCVYGAVGSYFTIPSATAIDVNLNSDVTTAVYRGYYKNGQLNSDRIRVSVADGKFYIAESDIYTIEYTAYDKSGNKAVKTLSVKTKKTNANEGIYVDWLNDNEFAEFFSAGLKTGLENKLPEFEVVSINDKASLNVKIYAKNDKETIEIDPIERTFIPKYFGNYTIEFVYSDNVYSYVHPLSINSSVEAGTVSFIDSPKLNRYYIKNAVYNIQEIFAYSYTDNGPQAHKAKAYVIFDGNLAERVEIIDLQKVKIEGSETVQFVFEYEGALPKYSKEVEIVDVGYGLGKGAEGATPDEKYMLYKYFKFNPEEVSVQTNDILNPAKELSDIVYKAKNQTGDVKLEFINPILGSNFNFQYKITDEINKFDTLRITLTPLENKAQAVQIDIYMQGTKTYAKLNDSAPLELKNFEFSSKQVNTISYSKDNRKIYFGRTSSMQVNLPMDGEIVDLDVELLGIRGVAGLQLVSINNQQFKGNNHEDKVIPEIYRETSQGVYASGDVITIRKSYFADVLSPIDYSSIQLTVKDLDQTYATSVDGILLNGSCDFDREYELKLTKLGRYVVEIQCKDANGRLAKSSFTAQVVDLEAPVITFTDGRDENTLIEMSINETVKVNYTVDDGNGSRPENIKVFVNAIWLKYNDYSFANLGNEFKLRGYGDWIVYVVAYDEQWNMSEKSFRVRIV